MHTQTHARAPRHMHAHTNTGTRTHRQHTQTETHTHTQRHTHRYTHRQRHRDTCTHRRTHRQTDRQTHARTHTHTHTHTKRHTDTETHRQTDRDTHAHTHTQRDTHRETHTHRHTHTQCSEIWEQLQSLSSPEQVWDQRVKTQAHTCSAPLLLLTAASASLHSSARFLWSCVCGFKAMRAFDKQVKTSSHNTFTVPETQQVSTRVCGRLFGLYCQWTTRTIKERKIDLAFLTLMAADIIVSGLSHLCYVCTWIRFENWHWREDLLWIMTWARFRLHYFVMCQIMRFWLKSCRVVNKKHVILHISVYDHSSLAVFNDVHAVIHTAGLDRRCYERKQTVCLLIRKAQRKRTWYTSGWHEEDSMDCYRELR